MNTTYRDAAAWAAGYADYLRVGGGGPTRRGHAMPTVRQFIAACYGRGGFDWTGLSVQR